MSIVIRIRIVVTSRQTYWAKKDPMIHYTHISHGFPLSFMNDRGEAPQRGESKEGTMGPEQQLGQKLDAKHKEFRVNHNVFHLTTNSNHQHILHNHNFFHSLTKIWMQITKLAILSKLEDIYKIFSRNKINSKPHRLTTRL